MRSCVDPCCVAPCRGVVDRGITDWELLFLMLQSILLLVVVPHGRSARHVAIERSAIEQC